MTTATRTRTRKTRASTTTITAGASAPGAIALTLDDLEVVEALLATTYAALGIEDADSHGAQITAGVALERLRAGMERVRAMRPTQD